MPPKNNQPNFLKRKQYKVNLFFLKAKKFLRFLFV